MAEREPTFYGRSITPTKGEDRRQIWFLESLDRLNRAMQGTNDVEQMMSRVLDAALKIFACDRTWLVYPCDPDAPAWRAVMEHTRPEFPGAFALGRSFSRDEELAAVFRVAREAPGAVMFGAGQDHPLPALGREFAVQSQMAMAVFPKGDQPYLFGLHQCSQPRIWTAEEKRLFEETGHRLADALTSVLMLRKLRESERRLDDAQRIAHVGHFERDLVSGEMRLSEEACRIVGLPADERVIDAATWRERWQALTLPEDRPIIEAAAAAVERGDPRYDVESRVLRPGGDVRILHSRGEVEFGPDGTPKRLFGVTQDITDLRRAEDALRASEARFRTFVEHAADSFFLLDDEPKVIDVNRQACESLGFEREELVGKSPLDFDADVAPAALAHLAERVRAGETLTFESRHRRKDGTVFPVEIRVGFFEEGGRRFLSLVRDITDRKLAEADRRKHIWFLESMDRVNRVIQGLDDLQRMMDEVLDLVLDIFQCDLASLGQYEDEMVRVVTVSSRRERPGFADKFAPGTAIPGSADFDALKRALRTATGPVQFVRGQVEPCYDRLLRFFEVESALAMELGTKLRGAQHFYQFTVSQRSSPRVWTADEVRLFEEIGRRIADGVTTIATLAFLQRSEARLAEAQRIAHLGHWEWDVSSDQFVCSDETASILGVPVEQRPTTFAAFRTWIHPEDEAVALRGRRGLLAGGSPVDFEHRILRSNGEVRHVQIRGTGIKGESGEVQRVFGTILDVTERKWAEQELRAAEERFRTYVDHATDALFVFDDEQGALVDVNRQACESLGFTRDELLRLTVSDVHPEIRREALAEMRDLLQASQTVTLETVHQRKDGTRFPVELRVRPFWRRGQRLALSLARDISERKRAEEERERMRMMESERESAIANERNRLAGEIHDKLAQGLAIMVMQLAEAETKLGPMWSHAEKALGTVRELAVESLAYARRSVSLLRPGVAAGGLTRAVRDIVEAARRHFEGSIHLDVEGEPALLPAAVESALIGIAREALTNAARHANAATVRVVIAFVEGNAVQLVVADDGVGFDPGGVSRDSFGLTSMQERASRAGIALTLVTEVGGGTEVVARWSS